MKSCTVTRYPLLKIGVNFTPILVEAELPSIL